VRITRWLIFAPVAILALFAPQANAEPVAGLQTTYYTIDEIPPIRSDDIYTVCGSEVENNINRSYEGEPFEDCTNDLFMVHMTGFIEIPEHNTIEFWLASDDGGIIDIDGNEWGNWNDQGCTWMESGQIHISAGNASLDLWVYENGGSSCLMLAWNIDGLGFEIVPDEAFTTNGIPTTTTTIQETTTSWDTTTTSTIQQMTTSTIAPSTTVPVVNQPTTTMPQIIYIPQPEPTMPDPPATVPLPQIEPPAMPEIPPLVLPEIETYPPETLELPPEIVDTMPFPVDTYPTVYPPDTLPFVGQLPEPPDTMPEPSDMMPLPPDIFPDAPELPVLLPTAIFEELPPELVQALEDAGDGDISLTDEQFDTVVDSIEDLTEVEAVALIEQILGTAVTADQAVSLATNTEVLAVVTAEQATEIFETLDVTELDNTELDALVDAVQDAPTQVRNAFEKTINVFDDGLGDYVPLGSNVPVDTRRTLIAVAAGAATVAAGTRRNK
jgi:hypothetical protein